MTDVVLLHGALGTKDDFNELEQALASEGFVVYTLNFSGHGNEPFREGFGIAQFASELKHFLDGRKLIAPAVFGYSMGGYVALYLSLQHPGALARIITLGTKFDWTPESAADEMRKLDPEKIEAKVPAFASSLRSKHSHDWKLLLTRTAAMMKGLGDHPLLNDQRLAKINLPVCIGVGDQDTMVDRAHSEKVANLLPDGKFTLLAETPHLIEKVDRTRLRDFLVGCLKRLKKP